MALSPGSCAVNVLEAYKPSAGLLDDMTPDSNDVGVIPPPETNTFAADFASAYDDYAKDGEVLGALNVGGDTGTIQSLLEGINSDTGIDIDEFAQAFADYWSGVAVENGTPSHGGVSVVSVENDCASKASEIASAIRAEVTDQDTKPYYENLINAIQSVIETSEWTVKEKMSDGSEVDFPETIS